MVAELRVMSLTLRGPTGALGGPVEQNRQSSVEIHMNRITGKPDPKFLDRYAWADSEDPDQTASTGEVWSWPSQ